MKKYTVGWWMYLHDDYVDQDQEYEALSEDEALKQAKIDHPRGKNFKIL